MTSSAARLSLEPITASKKKKKKKGTAAQLGKYQQGLTVVTLRTAPALLQGRLRPCWTAMAGYGPVEAALLHFGRVFPRVPITVASGQLVARLSVLYLWPSQC